jgi:hypothetical protein
MNMRSVILPAIAVAICVFDPRAFAYETETHAAMTSEATAQSSFGRSPTVAGVWNQLGVVDPSKFSFTDYYLDIGTQLVARNKNGFQERKIADVAAPATGLDVPPAYGLTGWLMQGAVREDDNPLETPDSDEPGGVFSRPFGHFYDTENNLGLTAALFTAGPTARDWALVPGLSQREGGQNHFKASDAREAMWRALTMTARAADGTFNTNVWPANWSPTAEELRQAYWNTTFRALGDLMHLVQDMAQPQHVRNDRHSGLGCVSSDSCLGGHSSFYEFYMKARTLQSGSFSLDEGWTEWQPGQIRFTSAKQLTYEGYPAPRFNSYEDYFGPGGSGSNLTGQGLANYTNRGFYSAGTNINNTSYTSPPADGNGLAEITLLRNTPVDMMGAPIVGALTLVQGNVNDNAFPGMNATNVNLSTLGIWDQFLRPKNQRSYTLNYYNYDDQAKQLIMRASAYSAGILDYFFRGRMKISLPDSGLYAAVDHAKFAGPDVTTPTDVNGFVGFGTVRLKLQNTTPSIAPPGSQSSIDQQMGQGTLVAVAKFHRNTCYKDDLSGESGASGGTLSCKSRAEEIVVSRKIDVPNVPGNAKEYEFTFDQQIPINAQDLYLQVVFRGVLGQEQDAVVVATKDIAEPTYVTVINSSDYIKIAKHVYTRDQVNADQTLLNQVSPTSCVVNSQLKSTCFGAGTISVVLGFYLNGGTLPSVSTNTSALPIAQFSRVAFLMDDQLDPIPQVSIDRDFGDGTHVFFPWDYAPSENQVYPDQSIRIEWTPVSRVRGAYQANTYNFVYAGDGIPLTPNDHIPLAEFSIQMADSHPMLAPVSFPPITP